MSDHNMAVVNRLRHVVFGVDDPRIRATWRFVLAWPLLPLVGVLVAVVMPLLGVSGIIPGGPLQGVFFFAILVVWARYIDRRSLSDYGVSASIPWVVTLLVGFAVVVGVWAGWHIFAASLGWMHIEWSMTAPQGSVLLRLGGILVSQAINTWVQDVVFFAIVLVSAAEGFRSRDIDPVKAVLGAWLVAVLFFTAIHGTPTVFDAAATAVGGAVFGLLYLHTGTLALTIGVHCGASYAAGWIFASQTMASQAPVVFEVTTSLPADIGGEVRIVLYLLTYLVLVGALTAYRGEIPIETEIAHWTERGASLLGVNRGSVDA